MRGPIRSRRTGLMAAGLVGAVAVAGAGVTGASATPTATATANAGHQCLVMEGSGDPAFTKNFNPFTANTMQRRRSCGVRSTSRSSSSRSRAAARRTRGSRKLEVDERQQDARRSTSSRTSKWTDGKPMTSADVVYSLTAGKQDKSMDIVGLTNKGTNFQSVKAKGKYQVLINLKTPGLAVHRREVERSSSSSRSTSGRRSGQAGDVH